MSLIGKSIGEFTAQAYHNEEFIEVSDLTLKQSWSVVVSIQRTSHLCVQQIK